MDCDLTRGIYRRVYAGFLAGKRINSVSLEAEAWFWRLHAVADDYGNLLAIPSQLPMLLAPLRHITVEASERWVHDLVQVGLIVVYEVAASRYINIVDFTTLQPAGKNGRRVVRFPKMPPAASGESNSIQSRPAVRDSGILFHPASPISIPNPILTPRTTSTTQEPDGFLVFWAIYPPNRKAARKQCLNKWRTQNCEPMADEILASLRAWIKSPDWTRDGGQYIPAPLVWLNQARWEAQPLAASKPAAKSLEEFEADLERARRQREGNE